MFKSVLAILLSLHFAAACAALELVGPEAREPAAATPEITPATEPSEVPEILRDPNLRRLIYYYGRLSREERDRFHAEMRNPEVRDKIRRFLDDPDRLRVIRHERPELYDRFTKHRDLEREYWELLREYHESQDQQVRAQLKQKIQAKLNELVDAETDWHKGELERLKQWIQRLEKGLEERLAHRGQLIQRRLDQDLKSLPPPPRFRPGGEEGGPEGPPPRGPRGRPEDQPGPPGPGRTRDRP